MLCSGPRRVIGQAGGAGKAGSTVSRASPIARSSRSLFSGASIAKPTGSPALVIPAGRLRPGMPAALPGARLRIKVDSVDTGTPLSMTVSSSPIFGNIALHQHDTLVPQPCQRCFKYRGDLGVQIFPEIAPR